MKIERKDDPAFWCNGCGDYHPRTTERLFPCGDVRIECRCGETYIVPIPRAEKEENR